MSLTDEETEEASERITALGLTRYGKRLWVRAWSPDKGSHRIEAEFSSGRPWHVVGYGHGRRFKHLSKALAFLEQP